MSGVVCEHPIGLALCMLCGGASTFDPEVIWRSLTPTQASAFLKAAPRVAGPWTDATETHSVGTTKRRVEFRYTDTSIGILNVGDVWEKPDGTGYAWIAHVSRDVYAPHAEGEALSLEAARAACDAALVGAEWILA